MKNTEKSEIKKAFVTGANGFLGVNLIEELLKEGWDVTALHLPGDNLKYLEQYKINLQPGNILDYQSLLEALSAGKNSVLFHLAGDTSMWYKNNERQFQINVTGTRNVCKAALEMGVKKLVYTSSSSAFGYHSTRIKEDTKSNALSCGMNYNRTKYLSEQEIKKAVKQGLEAVILNPCNMMGPYDSKGWSTLIKSMAENKAPGVSTGIATFAHVRDIAGAHIRAAEKGISGENYLLGGVEISFYDVFNEINTLLGKTVSIRTFTPASFRIILFFMRIKSFFDGKEPLLTYPRYKRLTGTLLCDDSKARKELDFSTVTIQKMLHDSHQWLIEENLIEEGRS